MSNKAPAGLQTSATLATPPATGGGYTPAAPTTGGGKKSIPRVSTSFDSPDFNTTQAITNNIYQNLMGRDATPAEVAQYHQQYLAYAANHPTNISHSAIQVTPGEVPLERNSTSTSTGLSESDFIGNLIKGTAESKDYRAATTYMDAINSEIAKARQGAY